MHCLILHKHYCPPESGADTRSFDMTVRLAEAGHKVTVITSSARFPGGKGFDSHSTAARGDVNLVVVTTPDSKTSKGLLRFWRTASFTTRATWAALKVDRPDVVFTVSTPMSIVVTGVLASLLKAAPLILEIRELWPGVRIAGNAIRQPAIKWLARLYETYAYRFAKHVVALSPGIKEEVVATGKLEETVSVIPHFSDTDFFRAQPDTGEAFLERYKNLSEGPLVTYAGPLNTWQDGSYLVNIASAMQAINPSVRFLVCGDGDDRDNIKASAEHAGVLGANFWLLPPQPKAELSAILNASALAFSIASDSADLHHYASASVSDAFAARRPVAINHAGWQAALVESRSAGIRLPSDNADQAASELAEFLSDTDGLRRAREQAAALADTRFNLDKLAGELKVILEAVASSDPAPLRRRKRSLLMKRAFDIVASAAGLVVLAPVLIAIAVAILIKMGWPIFFTQQRPGLKGQPFRLIKFRTMLATDPDDGTPTHEAARMTPLGQFLRRTSLDELPELFNVLIGDMSLVGPRPLLMEYLPYYTPEQASRHDVRPGITGLAQVRGRNALTWEDKFALDVGYVNTRSFWLDLKILWETLPVVLGGRGVTAPGHATMPRFDEIMARRQGAEDES